MRREFQRKVSKIRMEKANRSHWEPWLGELEQKCV